MKRIPVFDAHCDTISWGMWKKENVVDNTGMVDLKKTPAVFERYSQLFALFANSARPNHATYNELLACFRQQMKDHCAYVTQCRTIEEAEQAHKQGKAAAFLSVEGAELLDCDVDRLVQAASDGVIAINLTWNNANAISGSNVEEPERGLSPLGRQFVMRMQELGVLVDVSHLSDPGFWDVIEIARKPIIASHSNARAVWNHTRNLTDEQITAIIKNQGIIGLNFYRDFIGLGEDFDAVRAHLDHILSLGGEKQVALGGDWDGCDTIDALPTVLQLADLYEYLLVHNYSETMLEDLFYNNLMRVVRDR